MRRETGGPLGAGGARGPGQPLDPQALQERVRLSALAVQRLAEMSLGLADVRQALVEAIANLPIEETWMGFDAPLAELDRIALQLDALYTELTKLLGLPPPPL
jgi:hypothetical protein